MGNTVSGGGGHHWYFTCLVYIKNLLKEPWGGLNHNCLFNKTEETVDPICTHQSSEEEMTSITCP